MNNVGLIAGSYKPYHAGHDGLVRWAARENDEVHLFVSLSDRKRPGEVPILGADMEKIWKSYIEPTLPKNVTVHYGGSPVRNLYDMLAKASESRSEDTYTIYSDPTDLAQNYPETNLLKYVGNLYNSGQIILKPIERVSTVNVSGTKMRQYIETGDKKSFISNLPKSIDGNAVWDVLRSTAATVPKKAARKKKNEALVREFVQRYLSLGSKGNL